MQYYDPEESKLLIKQKCYEIVQEIQKLEEDGAPKREYLKAARNELHNLYFPEEHLAKIRAKHTKHKLARFDKGDILTIKKLMHQGYTQTEVARIMNCGKSTIHRVVKGNRPCYA